MFEAINSVMDAISQASRPRSLSAWLVLIFALGSIWYVAAGIMRGPDDPVALAGGSIGLAALATLLVRAVVASRRNLRQR
jgi:H+/Cl- antiporter ClcA